MDALVEKLKNTPKVNNCCGCINSFTGAKIIAIFGIIMGACYLIATPFAYAHTGPTHDPFVIWGRVYTNWVGCCSLLASSILYYGLSKSKPEALLCYLCFLGLSLAAFILPLLVETIAQFSFGSFVGAFINIFVGGFSIALHSYFLIVVKSVYTDMNENKEETSAMKA